MKRDEDKRYDEAAVCASLRSAAIIADVAIKKDERIAELEAALREMHASIPGGTICDPQAIADGLRQIAERAGVKINDE